MAKTYSFRLSFLDGVSKPITSVRSSMTGFSKSIDNSENSVQSLESSIKDLTRVVAVMGSQMNGEAMGKATQRTTQLNKGILTLTGSTLGLNRGLGRLAGSVGAAFAIGSTLRAAVGGLVEMESAQARFSMLLGRNQEATQEAFQKIQTFAVSTPFSIADSTKAFELLLRQGLNPTVQELGAMGDIAAFSGKSMEDFAGILERAQKLDFSALEELGVKAEESGNKVKLTFQGQTQTIANNSEAVRKYVMEMANNGTVAGAMAAQSETTGGKIETLKDKLTILSQTLGEALKPAIDLGINAIGWLSDKIAGLTVWVQDNWHWLGDWVSMFGQVAIAAGGAWAAMKVFGGAKSLIMGAVTAVGNLASVLKVAKIAQLAFNAAAKISPLGWIGIAIGALTTLFGYFTDFADWLGTNLGPAMQPVITLFQTLWGVVKSLGDALEWVMGLMNPVAGKVSKIQSTKDLRSQFTEAEFQKMMQNDSFRKQFEAAQARETSAMQMPGETQMPPTTDTSNNGKPPTTTPPINETGGNNQKTVSQVLAGVQGDSGAAKNITINIQKLVEQLVIQTTNINETPAKIKEEIAKALLGAVNDINTM